MKFGFDKLHKITGENSPEFKESELRKNTTVYINAGGRGTRLNPVMNKTEKGITKALIEFDGEPMIQKHVNLLLRLGFPKVIVGAGDHTNVKNYFKGQEDERLIVVNENHQEDTGGDLIKAMRAMHNHTKNVLVENVDTILYIENIDELLAQHERTNAVATIVLTTRKNVPNEGAFYVDNNKKVIFTDEARNKLNKPTNWSGFRASSTGTILFDSIFLKSYNWNSGDGRLSIYRDIVPELIKNGALYAYNNGNNMFVDIGTPEKYFQVKRREKKLFDALGNRYLNQDK